MADQGTILASSFDAATFDSYAEGDTFTLDYGGGKTAAMVKAGKSAKPISGDFNSAIEAHRTDTTDIHGIPDGEVVETTTGSQTKADAAQSAAIAAAATDATTKADAARVAAIAAASADATSKANAAQSTAISSASSDATTKANTAQSAAEATASAALASHAAEPHPTSGQLSQLESLTALLAAKVDYAALTPVPLDFADPLVWSGAFNSVVTATSDFVLNTPTGAPSGRNGELVIVHSGGAWEGTLAAGWKATDSAKASLTGSVMTPTDLADGDSVSVAWKYDGTNHVIMAINLIQA